MSESTEMYLLTIARLNEAGVTDPISLSKLAEEMKLLPVSVNQMIHRLEADGLIEYIPYKGAYLTPTGRQKAHQILRFRRLWEVFLVDHLGYSSIEADAIACRLEHVFPDEAAERLADFLDHPTHTHSGDPIPKPTTSFEPVQEANLAQLNTVQKVQISRLVADLKTSEFLSAQGISAGEMVNISAIGSNGDFLLKTPTGNSVHLSNELTSKIFVALVKE